MKLDKDTLRKNQFWFVLVSYVLIWVVALCLLKIGAAGAVEEKKQAYEKNKKAIEDAKKDRPKNRSFNEPWEKYGQVFASHKDEVWKQAWETQNPPNRPDLWLFDWGWALSSNSALSLKRIPYITDDIRTRDLDDYCADLYKRQFEDLDKQIKDLEPVDVVPGVITPVEWTQTPIKKEEFWYAQEDIWVRKEMLRIVKRVLDNVGHFQEVPEADRGPMPKDFAEHGIKTWYRYRNMNWELDLAIEPSPTNKSVMQVSPISTIRNIHPGKRTLSLANPKTNKGQKFKFVQRNVPYEFTIEGEPQPYQAPPVKIGKVLAPPGLDLTRDFDVYQVFDWSSSPVRRIDRIEFPYNCQRLADKELKPHKDLPKPEEATDTTAAAPGGLPGEGPGGVPGPGGPPGGMRGGKFGGMPGMGDSGGPGMMGMGMGGDFTPNGLRRDRYLQTTETSRALPLGLVLIVDQANIPDVLVTVTDSRLRIQVTQVAFNHVRGIMPPVYDDPNQQQPGMGPGGGLMQPGMGPGMGRGGFGGGRGTDIGDRGPGPGARGGKFGGGSAPAMGEGGGVPRSPRGGMPSMGPGGMGPGGFPGMPGMTGMTSQDEDDPNLVELSIYGIATLYERYPPKPPDPNQTTDANKTAEKKN
jgi:hypothetical protein